MKNHSKYKMNQAIYCLSIFVVFSILSGCMQSNAATTENNQAIATKPKKVITDNTLKVVNAAFYQTFILGDWRYKGAQNRSGKINAYVQIPAPLDMSRENQKSYLRTAICPSSAHVKMWDEIGSTPLSVHIYTHKQKQSLFVDCKNPLIAGT